MCLAWLHDKISSHSLLRFLPFAAVVLVGERKDSQTYVNSKKKGCAEVGFESFGTDLSENASEEMVLQVIRSAGKQRPRERSGLAPFPPSMHIGCRKTSHHIIVPLIYATPPTTPSKGCPSIQQRPQGPRNPRPAAPSQAHQ